MHVELHPDFSSREDARAAVDALGACVHCGFCLATCPTYLDSGDERDSPRGRIYLIRSLLEEGEATALTRTHLDRCLSCRSCETTCPSGVNYHRLLDFGRAEMERQAPRPVPARGFRQLLRALLTRPRLFGVLLRMGQWVRPLAPGALRNKIPPRQRPGLLPTGNHPRRVLALAGCVQAAATPRTTAAAARILDRLGIGLDIAPEAGCCGAVNYHLGAHEDGLDNMRANIDAWWPAIEAGAEAIISTATGCGATVADYGALLAHDPAYAGRAAKVSALHCDIAQLLAREDLSVLAPAVSAGPVAVHIPCSQQHALGQHDGVRSLLARAGFTLAATRDDHLCCGSAGTYSILEPERSERLRQRKLEALTGDQPAVIVTANIGCQLQLAEAGGPPVRHWLELFDPAP